jgi:hypothetical protein
MPQLEGSEPPREGILTSNVETLEVEAPAKPRGSFPLALLLGAILLVVIGLAAGLVLASGPPRSQPAVPASISAGSGSTPTQAPLSALSGRSSGSVAALLPPVNGISCDALESTVVHIHVHLAIFINGEEQQIPFGVGIGQPWQVTDTGDGPFVADGSCFYWIHTHTDDGIIHIESPLRRRFTLGDFFAIWQVPLSTSQVGTAQGPVITYVNGQRSDMDATDIPLLPHERIQLDVGADVPPYQFDFPAGV